MKPSGLTALLWRTPRLRLRALGVFGLLLLAVLGPLLAPQDPQALAGLELADARLPPAWMAEGRPAFLLGSDAQGRDLLSALLHGLRLSLGVALAAVAASGFLGVGLGLLAGWFGGVVDALLMRLADLMLAFPAILVALMVDGVLRGLGRGGGDGEALGVLVLAIAAAGWVPYARSVRGATQLERRLPYVDAARLLGRRAPALLAWHVLPNVMGPVAVLATLQLATAILTEATLSYLGVGVPADLPSLGSLVRLGQDHVFSGEWWLVVFPGLTLALTVLALHALGEAWREAARDRRLRG